MKFITITSRVFLILSFGCLCFAMGWDSGRHNLRYSQYLPDQKPEVGFGCETENDCTITIDKDEKVLLEEVEKQLHEKCITRDQKFTIVTESEWKELKLRMELWQRKWGFQSPDERIEADI